LRPSGSNKQEQVLLALTIAAAALIHVSIAASQILLGASLAWLLFTRRRLPFPRIWVPLLCLFVWTVLADLVSPDPWLGRAQIKKFYDFLFLPLIFSVFSVHFTRTRLLIAAWIAVASVSGAWGLLQFAGKHAEAKRTGADFYVMYVGHRITGFESHWMTFGALQLSVLSLVLAHWFFAQRRLPIWVYAIATAILTGTVVLGWTRSIWLAAIPSIVYLIWCWRPKMMFIVPVAAVLAFFIAPAGTRDRITSLVQPHGETDSNRHRVVTFRTGVEMVKAHPVFGIGPEEIGRKFDSYVPADIRRPLPVGYYGHLHNIYVQYAAERGIPGLLCVLWLIGLTVWDAVHTLRRVPRQSEEAAVLHGAIAVIIGILVGGIFEYNLGDSEVLMMFVCVLGLVYAAKSQVDRTTETR
jgi:putative inorganic carbon (hco3(-)) transporter